VGKVPDPKSQVEQITIALIYKFMDDMDAEAEELGGKRKFFTGDYARFGWAKLMRSGLGGHETLNLYAESIATMPKNPGIPPLFREIFKNAYLPYRDPETLKSFLKIIDEFSYDHSERLGDAFEYLLSVLGSQGDAGQFRTPRHIIDFIVSIVDPKKTDTILDPACGTAGFLISAYKHVLASNTDAKGKVKLTPDERGKLAQHIKGYDISPDMVRLSLVNLYLHGFSDPHIYEYDTLTQEERWNELADVILANPPFMSPKGGIKPHKKFSIDAKRSEVLFVDYMAEHLTTNGRAGIIVPEGIIFQSQGAYRDLRKMLIKTSLVAVISLPAGCFNPYSGVKTSILILDKSAAKQSDTIGFFKVENDGYGLGAQRRAIDGSDLPQVKTDIEAYLGAVRSNQSVDGLKLCCGIVVPKNKISDNGEYTLSGERYREGGTSASNKWPMVELGKVARLINGRAFKQEELLHEGPVPVLRVGNFFSNRSWYYSDLNLEEDKYCHQGDLLYAWSASFGPRIWEGPRAIFHYHIWKIETTSEIEKKFLFHLLAADSEKIKSEGNGIAMMHATKGGMEQRKFPLPPLNVQREIVAEIEGYQKVIDGARAVIDSYRPHIPIHPDWPKVTIGDISEAILTGPFGSSLHESDYVVSGIPVINPQNIVAGVIVKDESKSVSSSTRERLREFTLRRDDIVVGRRGEMGRCALVTAEMEGWLCGTGCFVIRLKPAYAPHFVYFQLTSPEVKTHLEDHAVGVTLKNLNQSILSDVHVQIPSLAIQQAIVAEIEVEQALVGANRELIARFEKKIKSTLVRVWGEGALAATEA